MRVEVNREKIDKFESSFKIGYFEYNRIYEPHIANYLESMDSAVSPAKIRNIKDYNTK